MQKNNTENIQRVLGSASLVLSPETADYIRTNWEYFSEKKKRYVVEYITFLCNVEKDVLHKAQSNTPSIHEQVKGKLQHIVARGYASAEEKEKAVEESELAALEKRMQ